MKEQYVDVEEMIEDFVEGYEQNRVCKYEGLNTAAPDG
jgi:hypothetical protein